MERNRQHPCVIYRDDGQPESRDCDDNYQALAPRQPRCFLLRLLRRPPGPPHTPGAERILPPSRPRPA